MRQYPILTEYEHERSVNEVCRTFPALLRHWSYVFYVWYFLEHLFNVYLSQETNKTTQLINLLRAENENNDSEEFDELLACLDKEFFCGLIEENNPKYIVGIPIWSSNKRNKRQQDWLCNIIWLRIESFHINYFKLGYKLLFESTWYFVFLFFDKQ